MDLIGRNAQVWIGCELHDAQALGLNGDNELQAYERLDAEVISIVAEVVIPDDDDNSSLA